MNVNGPVRMLATAPGTMNMVSRMSGNMGVAAASHPYLCHLLKIFGAPPAFETDGHYGANNNTSGGGGSGRAERSSHVNVNVSGALNNPDPQGQGQGQGRAAAAHIPGNAAAVVGVGGTMDTTSMVQEYLRHCLAKVGVHWETGQRDPTPSQAQTALRELGDLLYQQHSDQFTNQVDELNLAADLWGQLGDMMDGLFEDGEVNWGRIVALLVFVGRVAVKVGNKPHVLTSIADCVANFLDNKRAVRTFFDNCQGGWGDLVAYRGDKPDPPSNASSGTWLKAAAGTAAAAGLLGLFMFTRGGQ